MHTLLFARFIIMSRILLMSLWWNFICEFFYTRFCLCYWHADDLGHIKSSKTERALSSKIEFDNVKYVNYYSASMGLLHIDILHNFMCTHILCFYSKIL